MEKSTIKSTHETISKWDRFAQGIKPFGEPCPLCSKFGHDCRNKSGEKCPIYIATDCAGCFETDYYVIYTLVSYSFSKGRERYINEPRAMKDIANIYDMTEGLIDFLVNLLPEEERERYEVQT
jgi:hypothetical protein